ncbi:MAG: nucleotidyltransferase domain-containing protein [Bradymonadaceae bacterium]
MPSSSSNSARIYSLDREGVLDQLREAAESLLDDDPRVRRVLLFGSVARDDATAASDADVVVLFEGPDDRRVMDRALDFGPPFEDVDLQTDVLAYTLGEWDELLDSDSPFHQRADREALELARRS